MGAFPQSSSLSLSSKQCSPFLPHPAILQPESTQVWGKEYFLHFYHFSSTAYFYLVYVTLTGDHSTLYQVSSYQRLVGTQLGRKVSKCWGWNLMSAMVVSPSMIWSVYNKAFTKELCYSIWTSLCDLVIILILGLLQVKSICTLKP